MRILWIGVGGAEYNLKSRQIYQQLFLMAKRNEVTLIVKRKCRVDSDLRAVVKSIFAVPELLTPIFCVFLYIIGLKSGRFDAVYTKLTSSVLSGFAIKLLFKRVYWIVNLNDHPEAVVVKRYSFKNIKYKTFVLLLKQFRLLAKSNLAIVVGSETKNGLPKVFASEYHVSLDKMLVVSNGVDLDMFRRTGTGAVPKSFTMVYVGPFGQEFGTDILMKAVAIFKEYNSNAIIKLIGYGSDDVLDALKEAISKLGIEQYVEYLGEVKSERLPTVLETCHVGIYPFRKSVDLEYVFPVKVYNYLAMELPVVASRLYGVSQIVKHRYNGLLVKPDDPQDLARALISLSKDEALYMRLRRHTRRSVMSSDWNRLVDIISNRINGEIEGNRAFKGDGQRSF